MKDYSVIGTPHTSGSFPDVKAVDASGAGETDGTPVKKIYMDNDWGARQALMAAAGLTPNGVTEAAGASQTLEALEFLKGEMQGLNELATPAKRRQMISTGLWDEGWGVSNDSANVIEGGSTKAYKDMCVVFNAANQPRLLVLDATNTKIEAWDPRTLTLSTDLVTSPDLSANLPSGGTEVWEPYAMCTDGTSVYAMFKDTDSSPNVHRIQAWNIAAWTVKSGWDSVNGTLLPRSGNPPGMSYTRDGNVIIAINDSRLATANCWVSPNTQGELVSIINIANGVIQASGEGDAPAGLFTGSIVDNSICSDGTNVFFTVVDAGSSIQTCSAQIGNPSIGCGGTGYPYSNPGLPYRACSVSCNSSFMISVFGGRSALELAIITHNSGNATLDRIMVGQNSYSTPLPGDKYIMKDPCSASFDGTNLWVLSPVESDSVGVGDVYVLVKIDAARLSASPMDHGRQLDDIVCGVYLVPNITDYGSGTVGRSCKFDGRDMWVLPTPWPSVQNSGKIYRLPLADKRS